MEKFTPYEKLSKKKRRELSIARRGSWGSLNPVTRKPENPKAYNRKKARKWSDESPMTVPFDFGYFPIHLVGIKGQYTYQSYHRGTARS